MRDVRMPQSGTKRRNTITQTLSPVELGFEYNPTDHMYLARTISADSGTNEAPQWTKGRVVAMKHISLSPASAALNYGQIGFEGMKAVRTPGNEIVLFRPNENASRLKRTADRLAIPPLPEQWFVEAVEQLVRRDAAFVPAYHEPHWSSNNPPGSRSLYLRPVILGSGSVLGVQPASEYTFYIFANPVGTYRHRGSLLVLDSTHRAPAFGIGDVKASANYAATLRPLVTAKSLRDAQGEPFVDVLYLDARHDKFIEEVGSSNFFAVLKDGTLVTPRKGSILPGITRDSVITLAREVLGWKVIERDVILEEVLHDAEEVFFTGTAAVIIPVTYIRYKNKDYAFKAAETEDPTDPDAQPITKTGLLRRTLTDIQFRRIEDPFGWVYSVT